MPGNGCFVLNVVIYGILQIILLLFIQGAMTARVCALYGNTRRTTAVLVSAFIATQLFTLALSIPQIVPPYGFSSESGNILGVPSCMTTEPGKFIVWLTPVSSSISLAYELALFCMVLYKSFRQLRDLRRQQLLLYLKSTFVLLVQHSTIYFLV